MFYKVTTKRGMVVKVSEVVFKAMAKNIVKYEVITEKEYYAFDGIGLM